VGKKLLSVCGSKELSSTAGYVQYRFGRNPASIELEFPPTKTHPSGHFHFTYEGQGAKSLLQELQFQQAGYRYTVHAFGGAFTDSSLGVDVIGPNGKRVSISCADLPVANADMHMLQWLNLPPTEKFTNGDHR
jgi:hypothetical protein